VSVCSKERESAGSVRTHLFLWRNTGDTGYKFAVRVDDLDLEKIMASGEDPPTFMANVLRTPNTAPSISK
jgi:hypothetical protein